MHITNFSNCLEFAKDARTRVQNIFEIIKVFIFDSIYPIFLYVFNDYSLTNYYVHKYHLTASDNPPIRHFDYTVALIGDRHIVRYKYDSCSIINDLS